VNVPTWEERHLLERAVEIARGDEAATLEARARHLRAFYDAYRWLKEQRPAEVDALKKDVARYDRVLRLLGLTDEEVRAQYGVGSVVRWLMRLVRTIVIRLPLGLLGAILHAIPYRIPRWLAERNAEENDQPASWKLFSAIVVFPVWWLLLAGLAWWRFGIEMAAWTIVVAPISGFIALLWLESGITLFEQAKAFLLLPRRRALLAEVSSRREAIRAKLAEFEQLWRAAPAEGGGDQSGTTR